MCVGYVFIEKIVYVFGIVYCVVGRNGVLFLVVVGFFFYIDDFVWCFVFFYWFSLYVYVWCVNC